MMARANEFGEIHSGLSSLSADGWEGRAADHFRSKFEVQIKGWVDAQEAFSSASEAYASYASALASAQSQCDGIRARWKQGRDAVLQAQNNQADARSQAAADGGTPMFDASCDEGPGRSTMAAAVADFQTLVDQVNEAGNLLITALNAGISKLPERTWWDSVKRTVGSILGGAFEAVVEVLKLVWKLSGAEGIVDFGRILRGDMTLDEYLMKHFEMPIETLTTMAKALWNDPAGFMTAIGKSLIDWDTWTDDPGRAIGHLLPDVALEIATMGGSAGVSAGEKALTGSARALRIGKAVVKAILPINPDDIRALSKLGKNLVGKLTARGFDTASDLADLANTAQRAAKATDHAHDLGHAANGIAGALDGAADAGRATHAASGGGGIASGASHAANGAGSASHGVSNAADAAGNASHAAHAGGNGADAAGNASHASHGGAGVKDSALPPTDPGHRTNGVSSAAQPAATPHASTAGDASTGGHAAPANTAPSASHGAHNNAFMNADTGGATHGAGSIANGATGAPAAGAGTHGAPATDAPATGTHGAPATSAPAPGAGTHGAGTTGAPATGAPSTGAGTHGAPATGAPATGAPATGAGTHGAPAAGAPATGAPATGTPATGTHGAGSTANGATSTPDVPTTPPKKRSFEEILGGDKQHTANGTPDAPTTHADEAADAAHTNKSDKDSGQHTDADPKAKDHSANGKADDAADSARHGDKTEADKPTSDKSHKEDDATHHDGDTKPTKDETDTHKSDDDNSGAESDNSTVTGNNGEEPQEIKSEEGTDETKRNPHSGDPDHNWGTYVDEDGIPHIDPSDPRPYLNPNNRPSYRKGIVDAVREAFTDADGVLRDWRGKPIDWQPGQPRKGIWDMGHKPGHKYSDVWRSYVNGEMTPQQFLDWYNEPKNYRVEFSSRNRGHYDE